MDVKLDSCTRADDGTLTVYVNVIGNNGENIKRISVSGANAQEIEDALHPRLQAVKDEYESQQALNQAAQARLDTLKSELGFGTGS